MSVKIAIIGTGLISNWHIPAVQAVTGAELAGICDKVQEKAHAAAEKFQVNKVYADADEVFADPSVDAVVISVPNRFHHDLAVAAARARKHILLEKPVAHDLDAAKSVLSACNKAGVKVAVGHQARFLDVAKTARSLISQGVIGKVHSFRSVFSEIWDVVSIDDYRWNLTLSGGATLMDLTVHRMDIVQYLLGGTYTSVAASLRHKEMPKAVDDNVHMIVDMSNGATGTFTSDRFTPSFNDVTDFYGTEGSLHFTLESVGAFNSSPLSVYSRKPLGELPQSLAEMARIPAHYHKKNIQHDGWFVLLPTNADPYKKQMQAFVDFISGDVTQRDMASLEDGVHLLEVVKAAYLAQRERKWVDVPLPSDAPWTIVDFA
ncbi:Gfo/Idh/MocA family protein [Mesorhizobium sp. PL10]